MILLRRKEAMALLKLSSGHFSRAVNGKIKGLPPIPCIRIGRRQLFRLEALQAWLIEVERCSEARSKS